jgi:DNA modification methylase
MLTWKLEKRLIKDLKRHPKNPRQLSKEQERHLRTSLDKFGIAEKIIINQDNTIIGGHQRVQILKNKKHKEIDCWVPERRLTEKEVDELNIRLNKNTGDWDWDVLANQWEIADLIEWGFTPDELELENTESPEIEEEELPEPPKDPVTKLGDLYELGPHRLLCGDSTIEADVAKCLAGAKPILMVTDPPYGVSYDAAWRENAPGSLGNKWAKGKVKNDDKADWQVAYSLFPGSVTYIWHASLFCHIVINDLQECGFDIVSQIIWVKNHLVLSRGDYHWKHESCLYAVKEGHKHNWYGDRKQTTTWEISNMNAFGGSKEEDERTAHSTQKPLECMAKPIRNNTAKGEGVYDPFLGSGTTLIAAENLGRICYGIEIDPSYCDITVNRWIKTMQKNNKEIMLKKNGLQIQPETLSKNADC